MSQPSWGGSTAACALLVGNTLTVANLGDAEIVLGYPAWSSFKLPFLDAKRYKMKDEQEPGIHGHALLTHNVKPDEGQEVRRIEAGGGQVLLGRISEYPSLLNEFYYLTLLHVNGEVAVSRAFGDCTYKRPTWKTDLISSVPYRYNSILISLSSLITVDV